MLVQIAELGSLKGASEAVFKTQDKAVRELFKQGDDIGM